MCARAASFMLKKLLRAQVTAFWIGKLFVGVNASFYGPRYCTAIQGRRDVKKTIRRYIVLK